MKPDAIVHDFQEQLSYSQTLNDEGHWVEFYRRMWPDAVQIVRIDKHSKYQLWGVDREILLPAGQRVTIDEKNRKTDYGDFLCEEWSVGTKTNGEYIGQKVGWTLDKTKRCDFIAYCIPSTHKCWMLPFQLLRIACHTKIESWKRIPGRYPIDSHNERYLTRNVSVDWHELERAIWQQVFRQFGNGSPQLPQAIIRDKQMEFPWGQSQ